MPATATSPRQAAPETRAVTAFVPAQKRAPIAAAPKEMQAPDHQERKLDALTSLRFFAATMIVILHTSQLFNFNQYSCLNGLALWQGVSFFFVLSGFILAYVYPKIETAVDSNRFLAARFARVWPTHFVAFALTLFLVPSVLNVQNLIPKAIANLCMVQVWAFNPAVSESFNSVSWTISIELFFYLCFPFLIKDFDKKLKLRWLGAMALSLPFMLLCTIPQLAGSIVGNIPTALYIGENPLCRLLEFTLGIAVCWAFKKHPLPHTIGHGMATALELACLIAIAAAISLSLIWTPQNAPGALAVLRAWAIDIGGAPAYGALIFMIASERGAVSNFLKNKLFVRLGEISFSLYMFHLSILYVLAQYQSSFATMPGWLLPSIGFVTCLIVSHINFAFIETPFRRTIMNGFENAVKRLKKEPEVLVSLDDLVFSAPLPHTAIPKAKQFQSNPAELLDNLIYASPFPSAVARSGRNAVRKTVAAFGSSGWPDAVLYSAPVPPIAARRASEQRSRQIWLAAELVVLGAIALWLNMQFRFIPLSTAERIESHSLPTARDIDFGGKFKLRGLKMSRKLDGLHVEGVWQSQGAQRLKYLTALHLIDPNGKTLRTKVYEQDNFNRAVAAGKIWEDKIELRPDQLKGALVLGISLHEPPDGHPLSVRQGTRDGNGTRFLVAIPMLPGQYANSP